MTLIASLLARLTPAYHVKAAVEAEAAALDSRFAWLEAAESGELVNDVSRRMDDDRARNRYAERFADALGRDRP